MTFRAWINLLLALLFFSTGANTRPSESGPTPHARQAPKAKLVVTVVDENGVAVKSALISLVNPESRGLSSGETDYAGRCELTGLSPGPHDLKVEKEGFYTVALRINVGEVERAELVLSHHQEFTETVNVVYSPPPIDPTETASAETLTSREIINLPYAATRDIRNLLALVPGVLREPAGNLHIHGSSASQILTQVDGFNVSHPTSGAFESRVSVDAIRSIEVKSSRYSAEHGKGSGGLLSLAAGMGDDRYRFSATNFIPSLQTTRGVALDSWTPRATFSGPLRKKSAWFFDALDAEYNLDIIEELPPGADRNSAWRLGNLIKGQVNLTQSNILTATVLTNYFRADHAGLTRFSPVETTREARRASYLWAIKEQSYLASGLLLEVGAALNVFRIDERPRGTLAFVATPEGTRGNHFELAESDSRRVQLIANLFFPRVNGGGRHEFKTGVDLDHLTHEQLSRRLPITILRADGSRAREVSFDNAPRARKRNFEVAGYVQDRWSATNRLLVELGLRFDWDSVTSSAAASPRLALSYLVTADGRTKLAAGIGLFHDATDLALVTRPLLGRRFDTFYAPGGQLIERRLETSFTVDERSLKLPGYLNWSAGVDRRFPGSLLLSVEFIQKRTDSGFAFTNLNEPGEPGGHLVLGNTRRDRYHSAQINLRSVGASPYTFFVSYARSAARSNSLFDFRFDNPVLHTRGRGRMAWDAPNRLTGWGWLPLPKRFDLVYSVEWRDGYPFSIVNQLQRVEGRPNSRRFPDYFSLNLHAERRFRVWGAQWALRAGFNNLTNRPNPTSVDSNSDSPRFLTFGGFQDRAFTGRIRFLGRK